MEKFDYQGKRKDQVKTSENIVFWCILGMTLMIIGLSIYNFFTRL